MISFFQNFIRFISYIFNKNIFLPKIYIYIYILSVMIFMYSSNIITIIEHTRQNGG